MNISELIIKYSFKLAVWLIGLFYNKEPFNLKVTALEKMPEGTVGKSIADCLNSHKLKLVPGYESHELKHVVLGFAMTPLDEIRMQAFMLGNGNSSLSSLAIFLFGFVLLPHKWKTFLQDYRNGKNTIPIKHWTIEDYAAANLKQVRVKLLPAPAVNRVVKPNLAYVLSIASILAGGFGMLYCLPYLFSLVLEDLVGAGFPFLAGTILVGCGLVSLSIKSKAQPLSEVC